MGRTTRARAGACGAVIALSLSLLLLAHAASAAVEQASTHASRAPEQLLRGFDRRSSSRVAWIRARAAPRQPPRRLTLQRHLASPRMQLPRTFS